MVVRTGSGAGSLRNAREDARKTSQGPAQTKTPASTPQNDRYFVPTAPADVYSDPTADYANMGLESRNVGGNIAATTNNTVGPDPNAIANIYFDFNKSGRRGC